MNSYPLPCTPLWAVVYSSSPQGAATLRENMCFILLNIKQVSHRSLKLMHFTFFTHFSIYTFFFLFTAYYSLPESLSLAISIFLSSLLVKLGSLLSSFLTCCLLFLLAHPPSVQNTFCLSLNKKIVHCLNFTSAFALRGCSSMKHLFQRTFCWLVQYITKNFDLPLQFPILFSRLFWIPRLSMALNFLTQELSDIISLQKYFPQKIPQGQY